MRICGIYKIQSIIKPNRIYVGSSIVMNRRIIDHKHNLRYNKHKNIKLQNHVNKYGLNDLVFSILELCNENNIIQKEQYYLDLLNPYFNICKVAASTLGKVPSAKQKESIKLCHTKKANEKRRQTRLLLGLHLSQETKDKIRLKALNRPKTNETIQNMINSSHNKLILQYSLENNFIKRWHCTKCASKELKIYETNIRECCKNKRKTAGGFIWKYV
jgi:group I intron endonuclease